MINECLDAILNDNVETPNIALKSPHFKALNNVIESFNTAFKEKVCDSNVIFKLFIREGKLMTISSSGEPVVVWDIFPLVGIANVGTMKGKLEDKIATLITVRLNGLLGDDIRRNVSCFF